MKDIGNEVVFDTALIIDGDKTPCFVARHQNNEHMKTAYGDPDERVAQNN